MAPGQPAGCGICNPNGCVDDGGCANGEVCEVTDCSCIGEAARAASTAVLDAGWPRRSNLRRQRPLPGDPMQRQRTMPELLQLRLTVVPALQLCQRRRLPRRLLRGRSLLRDGGRAPSPPRGETNRRCRSRCRKPLDFPLAPRTSRWTLTSDAGNWKRGRDSPAGGPWRRAAQIFCWLGVELCRYALSVRPRQRSAPSLQPDASGFGAGTSSTQTFPATLKSCCQPVCTSCAAWQSAQHRHHSDRRPRNGGSGVRKIASTSLNRCCESNCRTAATSALITSSDFARLFFTGSIFASIFDNRGHSPSLGWQQVLAPMNVERYWSGSIVRPGKIEVEERGQCTTGSELRGRQWASRSGNLPSVDKAVLAGGCLYSLPDVRTASPSAAQSTVHPRPAG